MTCYSLWSSISWVCRCVCKSEGSTLMGSMVTLFSAISTIVVIFHLNDLMPVKGYKEFYGLCLWSREVSSNSYSDT